MLRSGKTLHCTSEKQRGLDFFNNEHMSDKAFFLLKSTVGLAEKVAPFEQCVW